MHKFCSRAAVAVLASISYINASTTTSIGSAFLLGIVFSAWPYVRTMQGVLWEHRLLVLQNKGVDKKAGELECSRACRCVGHDVLRVDVRMFVYDHPMGNTTHPVLHCGTKPNLVQGWGTTLESCGVERACFLCFLFLWISASIHGNTPKKRFEGFERSVEESRKMCLWSLCFGWPRFWQRSKEWKSRILERNSRINSGRRDSLWFSSSRLTIMFLWSALVNLNTEKTKCFFPGLRTSGKETSERHRNFGEQWTRHAWRHNCLCGIYQWYLYHWHIYRWYMCKWYFLYTSGTCPAGSDMR